MKTRKQTEPNASNPKEIDPALDPALDQLSRRTFLGRAGAGAAGVVAAAILPTNADAQEAEKPKRALDDKTLDRHNVIFTVKGDENKETDIKGFLAQPKTPGKRGSVIVIHEIFGVTDHIKDVTCRLAQAGYTALAPDLFTREGAPPDMKGGFEPLMKFVSAISDSQVIGDLRTAVTYLRGRAASNKKIGVVGFCWGGRMSMLLDGSEPELDAAVAYYGRISGDKNANAPAHPIDLVASMRAPLLGHFGALDQGIPPSEANKLRDSLKNHDKKGEIYVYDGAGHAFNNDTRESYNPAASKLAWTRTLEWFATYLKA